MPKLKKDMNKEILKYPLYYFNAGSLERRYDIHSTADYNHYELECHHYVPFTDWEKNTKNVQSKVEQKLILLPKVMHQHLENPVYRLPALSFEKLYGIKPQELLFDVNRRDFNTISENTDPEYDNCFDDVDYQSELKKYECEVA